MVVGGLDDDGRGQTLTTVQFLTLSCLVQVVSNLLRTTVVEILIEVEVDCRVLQVGVGRLSPVIPAAWVVLIRETMESANCMNWRLHDSLRKDGCGIDYIVTTSFVEEVEVSTLMV